MKKFFFELCNGNLFSVDENDMYEQYSEYELKKKDLIPDNQSYIIHFDKEENDNKNHEIREIMIPIKNNEEILIPVKNNEEKAVSEKSEVEWEVM